MTEWKRFISMLLTKNDEFQLVKSERIGDIDVEFFSNNSETTFKVGYLNEYLLYLNLTNPQIPGYNEHMKGEYFFADHFDIEKQSKTALPFDLINQNGVREIIENGLNGREEQYLLNNKVIYSKLFLNGFQMNFDFSNRTIWQKIIGPKIENMKNVKQQTIELNEVYSGNR